MCSLAVPRGNEVVSLVAAPGQGFENCADMLSVASCLLLGGILTEPWATAAPGGGAIYVNGPCFKLLEPDPPSPAPPARISSVRGNLSGLVACTYQALFPHMCTLRTSLSCRMTIAPSRVSTRSATPRRTQGNIRRNMDILYVPVMCRWSRWVYLLQGNAVKGLVSTLVLLMLKSCKPKHEVQSIVRQTLTVSINRAGCRFNKRHTSLMCD